MKLSEPAVGLKGIIFVFHGENMSEVVFWLLEGFSQRPLRKTAPLSLSMLLPFLVQTAPLHDFNIPLSCHLPQLADCLRLVAMETYHP